MFAIEMVAHPIFLSRSPCGILTWGPWSSETLTFATEQEAEAVRATLGNASQAVSCVREHEVVPQPAPHPDKDGDVRLV